MSPQESIPWFMPEMGAAEEQAALNVIRDNYVNDGPTVRRLETLIANRVGRNFGVGVTSGTAAISLALMACGVGPGDEVLVPDLTFIATANAVRMTGAEVKLVDVQADTFAIDPEKARLAIGPKTRAIVPVDVNGRPADYGALEKLCADHGLVMVVDAAEALGSQHDGRPLGSFGQAACFSFSANKTVSSGQGGMIVVDDEALRDRLKELKDQGRRQTGTGGDDLHPVMGFNFKYTSLQAGVALAQLDRLDQRLAHFKERDRWYQELLADIPGLVLPPQGASHGWALQWTDILVAHRDELAKRLSNEGIGVRPFWLPIHRQKPYAADEGAFAVATDVALRGLWLPSSFGLSRRQAEITADRIRHHLGELNG